ncbi:hypothetical protein SLA2020_291440 [Shorea laevis]
MASLKIGSDGNLKLVDGNEVTLRSSNVSVRSNRSVAVLLDNGKFVLQDGLSGQWLWRSFEHPGCLLWSEDLTDMQEFSGGGEELFVRLASSELAHGKLRVDLIISLTTVSCIIILGALVYGLCW